MGRRYCQVRLDTEAVDRLKARHGELSAGIRAAVDAYLGAATPDNPAGDPDRPAPTRQQGRKAKAVTTTATDGATAVAEPATEPPTWRFRSRWCRPCLDAKQPLCRACRHLEQMR